MTTSSEPEVQYWDSCVFIDLLLNRHPDRVKAILECIREARAGRCRIVLSTFVLAEVRPHSDNKPDYKQDVQDLLEGNLDFITWYAVTRTIALLARDIGTAHPDLTPADCVHLATALEAKARVFFTYDGEGAPRRRSRKLLTYDNRIGKPPLRIVVPAVNRGPLYGGR
jgi:predicted nucleic acid-binding protein